MVTTLETRNPGKNTCLRRDSHRLGFEEDFQTTVISRPHSRPPEARRPQWDPEPVLTNPPSK